ncbi:MAG: DUF2975 domain-containing protein [Chloroflexota bacterium]
MDRNSHVLRWTAAAVRIAYILTIVGCVGFLVAVVVAAAYPGFGGNGSGSFVVDGGAVRIDLSSGVDQSTARSGIIISFGVGFLTALVALAILASLRRLLTNVAAGKPFSLDNAGLIRRIGILVIAAGALGSLAGYAMWRHFSGQIAVAGVTLQPKLALPVEETLLGLIIICLSEVFRYGAGLQEEHDLTV